MPIGNKKLGFMLGAVISAALGVLMIPLLAWKLPPDDVARWSLLASIMALFCIIGGLGLERSYMREFFFIEEGERDPLFVRCVFLTTGVCAVGSLLYEIVGLDWLGGILKYSSPGYDQIILIYFVTSVTLRFFASRLRMLGEGYFYLVLQVLPKAGVLAAIFIWVAFQLDIADGFMLVLGVTVALNVSLVFCFSVQMAIHIKGFSFGWIRLPSRETLAFGLPLALSGVISWGLLFLDRALLGHLAGLREVAIYAVPISIASGITVVIGVFSLLWLPSIYKCHSEGRAYQAVEEVLPITNVFLYCQFLGSLIMAPLLPAVLPATYSGAGIILPACMLTASLMGVSEVSGIGINLSGRTRYALIAPLVGAAVCVLLSFWLAPLFGARGAAIASLVAMYMFFLLRSYLSMYAWQRLGGKAIYVQASLQVGVCVFLILAAPQEDIFWFALVALVLSLSVGLAHDFKVVIQGLKKVLRGWGSQ